MQIIKRSGEIVAYNPEKLKRSLMKSGAHIDVVENIMQIIGKEVHHGSTTKQIYKTAFGLLKKSGNATAARYNLREAIRHLGPAGFHFEKYISRIFESENYRTTTNITLQGKCVSHEIDVFIKKDNVLAMVECKFHGGKEATDDVKIPMYILSRFNDLKEREHLLFDRKEFITACWIVSNTRFTTDAIDFAKCSGLNLMSWNYPPNEDIKSKIDHDSLYPVTCLTTLTFAEKDKLLTSELLLVKELLNNHKILKEIGISSNRIKNVLKEVSELCK